MKRAKVEVYQSEKRYTINGVRHRDRGEWLWRLKATNGRIIADSGEGYVRQAECLRAVDRVVKAFGGDIKQMWVVLL